MIKVTDLLNLSQKSEKIQAQGGPGGSQQRPHEDPTDLHVEASYGSVAWRSL